MARRDALLQITKSLLNRRTELRKRLGRDLSDLSVSATASGDAADAAFDHTGEELASQLAELEARELTQVEHALRRIKQGKYGVCDGCSTKIPVVRLNALPYSTFCIKCQREAEQNSNWLIDRGQTDWNKLRDESGSEDRDFDIADLEMQLPK